MSQQYYTTPEAAAYLFISRYGAKKFLLLCGVRKSMCNQNILWHGKSIEILRQALVCVRYYAAGENAE